MKDMLIKKFNSTSIINESLPKIIEAFVTFYGEDERKNIEEKFSNTLIIGCFSPEIIKKEIEKLDKNVSNSLLDSFIEEIISETKFNDKDELRKICLNKYDINNKIIHPLNYYIKYLNGVTTEFNRKNTIDFLKNMGYDVTLENLDSLIENGTFKALNIIVDKYNKTIDLYQKHIDDTKEYREYVEKCKNLYSILQKKYQKLLIEELKVFFTEEEYKELEYHFESNSYNSLTSVNKKAKNILVNLFTQKPLICAFNEESDKLVEENSFRKDNILSDRIRYFKNLGYDLGDDYKAYEESELIRSVFPSKEGVKKILDIIENISMRFEKEYYESLPEFKTNLDRIKNAGIINYQDVYNEDIYKYGGTFIATTLKKEGDNYKLSPIMCISMSTNEYLDHNIIHEFNHIFESKLIKVENNKYYSLVGWDYAVDDLEIKPEVITQPDERSRRDYELFNEIINELLSQEICEILFNSNNYILNEEETAKIAGFSSYEDYKFIVLDFYNTYKIEIIESRKTGNLEVLYNSVGKENFEELNDLCNIYQKYFGSTKNLLKLSEDRKNNRETELTRIYENLFIKRDNILERMKEHKKQNVVNL